MKAGRGAIVVLAKAPRPGLVKTRMSPPLSPAQAAELYANLLDDVLVATAELAQALGLEALVAAHPPDARGEVARRAPPGMRVVAQHGADLGARMARAVAEAAAAGATPILLRGSDSPVLGRETVSLLLDALTRVDVAVCPDLDGGYNLIGLHAPAAAIFDHPMSTRSVLEDTLTAARAQGLRSELLPPGFDLDTTDDLTHLAAARERGDAKLCPRLLAYLDTNDLWPQRDGR